MRSSRAAGVVAGIAAAGLLAACGSSGGTSTAGGGSSSSAASSAPSSTASSAASSTSSGSTSSSSASTTGKTIPVKATEFAFALPDTHLAPGTYTFSMANDGHATHSMEIQGPGISDQKSSNAGPGGTSTMTVTLQPGTYTLWCPVGNHRAQGMQTTLTVG